MSCRLDDDSLYHLLLDCPACAHLCEHYFPEVMNKTDRSQAWLDIMSSDNSNIFKKFVQFIVKILEERATKIL